MRVAVTFTKLDERAQAPRQAHPGEDAGWDLFALEDTDVKQPVDGRPVLTWVRTGIAAAIPRGHYGRIVGRSSAASKGFHVIEGVMDSGYRGEQLVRVAPLWRDVEQVPAARIPAGTSLAQLIVSPIPDVDMVEVGNLPESQRGENGFGSSDQRREVEPEAAAQIRSYVEESKKRLMLEDEPPVTMVDDSGGRFAAGFFQDGDEIELTMPADPVARDLFCWWIGTAFRDFNSTVPKMLEYGGHDGKKGSADLRIIGEGLMELMGWEVTEENSRVAQELGCWFYDLGKGGRLVSDFQQRRPGKQDTWFDKSIYAMMARRIQETGNWP